MAIAVSPIPSWIETEMESLSLPDKRLEARVRQLIADISRNPNGSLPEICSDRAATQAAYNFFSHPTLNDAAILQAQRSATLARIQELGLSLVIAVQDSTEFNLNHHPSTTGLGPLSNKHVQGFFTHSTMALCPEGVPLGLLAQTSWVREESEARPNRAERPIEAKESHKWLTALDEATVGLPEELSVLMVSDRESDIFEYFAHPRPEQVDLLVRARHDRCLDDVPTSLRERLNTTDLAGTIQVEVTATPTRQARTATCEVRFQSVTLSPPTKRPGLPDDLKPIEMWAISVQESQPPEGEAPLEWLLLTSIPVTSFAQACLMIHYYTLRWVIERFHFVLKSGCAIEQRQLKTQARLHRFLLLANVVAWRLLWMTYLGRVEPELPASLVLDEEEWQALVCFVQRTPTPPSEPPTLAQAIQWIALLGGFLGRNSDGPPGVKVLWRGIRRLADITQAFTLFQPDTS